MKYYQMLLLHNSGKSKDEIFDCIMIMYNNLSLNDPYRDVKYEIGQQCIYYKTSGWQRIMHDVIILEIDVIREEILVESLNIFNNGKPEQYLIKSCNNLYIRKTQK